VPRKHLPDRLRAAQSAARSWRRVRLLALLQTRGHLTSFLTAIAMSSPPISTAKGVNVGPRPPCISVKAPAPNIITPSNAKAKRSNRRSGLVRSLRFFTIRSCPLDFAQAYTRCFLNRIHTAQTLRAQHLRPLCRLGDFHRRVNAAPVGLTRLVHAHACEEKESGDDAGGHTGTHPSSEAITIARNTSIKSRRKAMHGLFSERKTGINSVPRQNER